MDALLIGGAMAYTFLKAQGMPVGKSPSRTTSWTRATRHHRRARSSAASQLLLPVDHVVAPKLEAGAPTEALDVDDPAIGDRMGLDIGPKTGEAYASAPRREDGGLERPDGRVRDRRVRQRHRWRSRRPSRT